ncbi:Hippocampus abundant transcript-like protein 1 (Major facilitator superfamily domain-containing 14B) [Durusdinium trenchii]|uniref:Hippocampus abundant transcript-like protein 1 (Major facilitator superfamily domain-containing 14B) n=1 Tax=Durusdinium trenchii TaxID=1381693 RepID=A0ABP0JWV7_9DINO
MSELLWRSLNQKMEAPEDSGESHLRPLSVRDNSGTLAKKKGWGAFWTATLLENMGTILVGLIYPDLAVASLNGGIDPCAGVGAQSLKCQEALSKASAAFSMFGLIGAICSFLCIPIVGTAADHFGRRPLLIFSFLCSKVPTITLLCVAYANISIYFFFAALMITAMVPSTMLFWFWINDMTTQDERVRMFGRLQAFSNLEGIVIPFSAAFMHGKHAVLLLASVRLSAVLTVICFVPESRPPPQLRNSLWGDGRLAFLNRWQGVSKLCSDRSLRTFLPLAFIASGTGAGINSLSFLYCKARFGFQMQNFAPFISVTTLSNAIVNLMLINPLHRVLGLRGLFAFSLVAGTFNLVAFSLAPTPIWLMLACITSGLSNVGNPAIQALMSNLSESVQGMTPGVALGALQAVQSLVLILMPPLFQGIFSFAMSRHPTLLFLPFAVGSMFNLICFLALSCIPKNFFPRSDSE